jgi:hypothetical protein
MTHRAELIEEQRADLMELLWAYIETTKLGVLEWPPQRVDRQPTPVDPADEKQMLWTLAEHAHVLFDSIENGEAAGGQSG